jgi:hypothetical protein
MGYSVDLTRNLPDGEVDDNGWFPDLDSLLDAIKTELTRKSDISSFVFTIVPDKEAIKD